MNSAALPLPIAMLAFITLRNNCLLFIDLVQFCAGFLSKNKINATPVPLLVFLSFVIVTFTTSPYLENTCWKPLLTRDEGRLDTHTVLVLEDSLPVKSSGGLGRETRRAQALSSLGAQPHLPAAPCICPGITDPCHSCAFYA